MQITCVYVCAIYSTCKYLFNIDTIPHYLRPPSKYIIPYTISILSCQCSLRRMSIVEISCVMKRMRKTHLTNMNTTQ